MTNSARLVSFLGTGRRDPETGEYKSYDPTSYTLNGQASSETPWVVIALCELLRLDASAEIVVLATPTARCHTLPGLQAALAAAGLPQAVVVDFPEGGGETLWTQFAVLKDKLRAPAREVVLDITHGFRSFPFFGAAVAAFVRAVDGADKPLRIVYGAFDAPRGRGEPAPVWELTAFVELLDWAREIMLFLHTGRAAKVADRTEALGRALRRAWVAAGNDPKARPSLDRLAKALEEFGGDVETIRTGALLLGDGKRPGSAARLLAAVTEARPAADALAPPLADVLHRIEEMATPLRVAAPTLAGPHGDRALVALARLYLDMGRYAEAATIVREGWICRYADERAAAPGTGRYDAEARDAAEERRMTADSGPGRTVAEIRNDINHAGFRRQPKSAEKLKQQVRKLICDFAGAPGVFANISNHPSAAWSEAQRAAALACAGRIEDVPFPAVPPDGGDDGLDQLVEQVLARLPVMTTHAMVQGEFTLCFALVAALQRRGIVCYAATADRNVEHVGDARLSRFAFVRFREYPRLSAP